MIIFIAAYCHNYAMGNKGHLPWRHARMQHDTERLHMLANGKTLVMGEKTYHDYKDIQKTFQTKRVIVVSRSVTNLPDAEVVDSIQEIIVRGANEDLWVIGGGNVFAQLLPYATKMHLTAIDANLPGDVFFPQYNLAEWNVVQKDQYKADSSNPFDYTFLELQQIRSI